MSDTLDLKLQNRDGERQQFTRTVLKLTLYLDVETRRVARLRQHITRLKSAFRRKHSEVLSTLSDEGMDVMNDRLDVLNDRKTSSSESEPEPSNQPFRATNLKQ